LTPQWSPDGTRIAFARPTYKAGVRNGYEICTVEPDGTDVKAIYNKSKTGYGYNRNPYWSKDSTQLIFLACSDWGVFGDVPIRGQIMRGLADGSAAPAAVTSPETVKGGASVPVGWCWP